MAKQIHLWLDATTPERDEATWIVSLSEDDGDASSDRTLATFADYAPAMSRAKSESASRGLPAYEVDDHGARTAITV